MRYERSLPAKIYLFKVKNRNTRKRCEICPKLTIKQQNESIIILVSYMFSTHFSNKITIPSNVNTGIFTRPTFKFFAIQSNSVQSVSKTPTSI